MSCRHAGFPDHPFLNFAVSQQSIDPVRFLIHFPGQGHTYRPGYALSQGTGGSFHSGELAHIRMSLQRTAQLSQPVKIILGEKPLFRQGRIKNRSGMSFAENKAIPCLPARIFRVDIHFPKIQTGHYIAGGQRTSGMAGTCLTQHAYDVPAHLPGLLGSDRYRLFGNLLHLSRSLTNN